MNLAGIARRLDAYERLVRLDRPVGALLLLWPTLWAVWLASDGRPRLEGPTADRQAAGPVPGGS